MPELPLTAAGIAIKINGVAKTIRSYGVKGLAIFGSFARGTATSHSDLDLLVEFEAGKKNFDNFMKLAFLLEDISGRRVELVTPEALSPFIRPHIMKELVHVQITD